MSFLSQELEASSFLVFLVTSYLAKAKAAGRTLIIGRSATNVTKMTRRKFRRSSFDGDVGGNVVGIEVILFVLERNGERFDRRSAESFGFGGRRGHRPSRQLLLLRCWCFALPKIRIIAVPIIHVILVLRLISSSSIFLIPIIALQHTYSLSYGLISRLLSQCLDFS